MSRVAKKKQTKTMQDIISAMITLFLQHRITAEVRRGAQVSSLAGNAVRHSQQQAADAVRFCDMIDEPVIITTTVLKNHFYNSC